MRLSGHWIPSGKGEGVLPAAGIVVPEEEREAEEAGGGGQDLEGYADRGAAGDVEKRRKEEVEAQCSEAEAAGDSKDI